MTARMTWTVSRRPGNFSRDLGSFHIWPENFQTVSKLFIQPKKLPDNLESFLKTSFHTSWKCSTRQDETDVEKEGIIGSRWAHSRGEKPQVWNWAKVATKLCVNSGLGQILHFSTYYFLRFSFSGSLFLLANNPQNDDCDQLIDWTKDRNL